MTPVTPNVRETKHVLTQIKRPHDIVKITNHNAAVKLYDREKKRSGYKEKPVKMKLLGLTHFAAVYLTLIL